MPFDPRNFSVWSIKSQWGDAGPEKARERFPDDDVRLHWRPTVTISHYDQLFQKTRRQRQNYAAKKPLDFLLYKVTWPKRRSLWAPFAIFPYSFSHSSEIRGLHSTKCSSKTLQNLLYFMYKKTHVVFFDFHFEQLYFFPYECPGLCRHRPGHS